MGAIRQLPDPILVQKCKVVTDFDHSEFAECVRALKDEFALQESPTVGLAAPQIGFDLRVFVATLWIKNKESCGIYVPKVYVNPKIVNTRGRIVDIETCVSVPDDIFTLPRHEYIYVRYQDETGKEFVRELSLWPARIFQHERDHLDGILIPQRENHPSLTAPSTP